WYFIVGVGYDYLYAGENLAKDFSHSSGVVDAWMNSPTHRENLVNPRYEDIGLAVVNGTLNGVETTLVVQMFGRKKVSAQLAAVEPELGITLPPPVTIASQPAATPVTVEGPKEELAQLSKPSGVLRFGVPLTLASGGSPSQPLIDVNSFSKVISVLIGGFVASIFAVDSWVARRRFYYRMSGHTLAHLGLLILALFGVWFTNTGSIL
ncbi:CAP domain-containing protein, partial [Candidatus Parcubacteria bacterium]|nr:CAP domain-containing protein [Candidatus Parcubacteria bacterium]